VKYRQMISAALALCSMLCGASQAATPEVYKNHPRLMEQSKQYSQKMAQEKPEIGVLLKKLKLQYLHELDPTKVYKSAITAVPALMPRGSGMYAWDLSGYVETAPAWSGDAGKCGHPARGFGHAVRGHAAGGARGFQGLWRAEVLAVLARAHAQLTLERPPHRLLRSEAAVGRNLLQAFEGVLE
jgi:hypothetical protein